MSVARRVLGVAATVLWLVVGYMLALELQAAIADADTEHSPMWVAAVTAPFALVATGAWYAARRASR